MLDFLEMISNKIKYYPVCKLLKRTPQEIFPTLVFGT